jgi:hypothetical protein
MFLVWMLWPLIVSQITSTVYELYSGKVISKEKRNEIRRKFAGITRDVMKPV